MDGRMADTSSSRSHSARTAVTPRFRAAVSDSIHRPSRAFGVPTHGRPPSNENGSQPEGEPRSHLLPVARKWSPVRPPQAAARAHKRAHEHLGCRGQRPAPLMQRRTRSGDREGTPIGS
jgi:hypothetical protein